MKNQKTHDVLTICSQCAKKYVVQQDDNFPLCCGKETLELAEPQSKQFGEPTPAKLAKINRLAKRQLSKDEVFTFEGKLCGDMIIPNRHVKLEKPLLEAFKQNAIEGVSMLLDHSWSGFFGRPKAAIPYGRTYDAVLRKSDVEGEEFALYADHYIVRGKEMDGISTDSIIQSIEDGTMFDTSIGWGADKFMCSICNNDYRNYMKCEHIAGREYAVDGEVKLCFIRALPPGYLMENSLVFDGAYPTAGVLSAVNGNSDSAFTVVEDLKKIGDVPLMNIYLPNRGTLTTVARKTDMPKAVFAGATLEKEDTQMFENKEQELEALKKEQEQQQQQEGETAASAENNEGLEASTDAQSTEG